MKIWLIAENWPPRRGGIENYLSHVVEELARLGHSVTVIAPRVKGGYVEENILGVQVQRRRFFWPFVRPKWLPLFMWLWRRAKQDPPDLILCGKGLFEGMMGYYFKKHRQIPYFVCTYGMEIATWLKHRRTRRQLTRVLTAADRVLYINETAHTHLTELGVTMGALSKITPGVDERYLRKVAPTLVTATAEQYGIRSPYVLAVGRLVPRKGFDTLIEAVSNLDQTKHGTVKLVIVGDGPDQARLERIVADNYMQTTVVWLHGVPDKHLPALYSGAQLFALTPRDIAGDIEGFGIVYLEAAACGIPALGTTTGGVAEAVVAGETGWLVPPGDVKATTAALGQLLTDDALRGRLASEAKARVTHHFRWHQRGDSLNGLLRPFSR